MTLTPGETPEQLLREADAAAQMADMVGYEKDKRTLREQAERLRQRAHTLETSKTSVPGAAGGGQPAASIGSVLWRSRTSTRP